MSDLDAWVAAVRHSHDRFASLVTGLDDAGVRAPSYASEWSIADTASHLGSQAEIFGQFLRAGLSGESAAGGEGFGPIWDRWNAKAPLEQVADSVAANEQFVAAIEGMSEQQRSQFTVELFGQRQDLGGLLSMRLSEHAMHTWDVAVTLDSTAVVPADAVELLIDVVGATAGRVGKQTVQSLTITVATTEPERSFVLTTSPVALTAGTGAANPDLRLPAEALLRLVYGRLDPGHTPENIEGTALLPSLRAVFPGF